MKAQVSSLDLLFGLLLFIGGVALAWQISIPNTSPPSEFVDAQIAAEAMFAPVVSNGSFILPGFVVDQRVDESLWSQLSLVDLSASLGVSSEVYVRMNNETIGVLPSAEDAVSVITRYALRNGSVVSVEVGAWTDVE